MSYAIRRWPVFLTIALVLASGCARSPEARKARHLDRGDRYFKKEQYREAVIEYRNALRFDMNNTHALQQLGLSHFRLGELVQSYQYLLKAQELAPKNHEVRLKLSELYVIGRQLDEARREALTVLEADPKNLEALVLLGAAADTAEEIDAAIQRLEAARRDFGDRAKFNISMANLYLRKRDATSAERALQEAVAKDPKSIEARIALGNVYLVKRDQAEAERAFKSAAELAPMGSPARIQLANFYLLVQRRDEARRVLGEMTEKAPEYLPAWRRLAEVAFAEQRYDESTRALDALLKKSPSDVEGHLLRGRIHFALRQTTQAIQEFQQVLKVEPRLAPARYHLALAHLQAGNTQQAKTELKEATTTAPNFVQATLLLAQLNIRTNAHQAAIDDLEKLLAKEPKAMGAYILLGSAYLAQRDGVRATEAYRKVVALAPKDPRGPYLVGLGLRAQGKALEARKEFEAALALSPGYLDPLSALVELDVAEKKPEVAIQRVQRQIALVPQSGGLQYLLGRVHELRRENALAETAYLRAVELEPGLVSAYLQVGRLYATSGNYDEALAKVRLALAAKPEELGALMLSGILHQAKGDLAQAREAYETILKLTPRFAPAANNLAYLYSEHDGDKERALQLAQTAKEMAPEDPHVSDTLGWILYKRGVHQRALALLQESATKLPDNPEVQYHLGMAAYKVGEKDLARQALTRAVAGPAGFPGREEARRTLDEVARVR